MAAAGRWIAAAGRRLRGAGACLLLAALAACASLPQPEAVGPGAFSRTGRFAITVTAADGALQAVQGGFTWRDDGSRYLLDLTNPLGAIEARVEGQPGAATLTRANGSRVQAADPDALAEDALGSPVPVGGLRDWLRGRLAEAPAAERLQRDEQGRPTGFAQGGWQARLSRYDALGPQLLMLERQEADRRIVVRLVVNPQ